MRSFRPSLVASLLLLPALAHAQTAPVDSSLGRRRIRLLPAVGSAPETGLQYGATVLAVSEPALASRTRPASVLAYAIRTAKGQTRVGVEGESWTRGNARRYAGTIVWQRYPLPFYGIGGAAPEGAKEIFTPTGIEATGSVQQRVTGPLYAVTSVRVVDQTIRPDTIGALHTGTITGARGGRAVELSAGAMVDTRDHLFDPTRGAMVGLTYSRAADAWGSEFDYGRVRLDARAYRTLGGAGTLALGLLAVGVDGDAPFDQLATVGGGDILRGYTRGRYRDRWLAASQVEYRTPVSRRVGGVLFAGAGTVAGTAGALGDGPLLPTYGAGLRVRLDAEQRTAVRVDYGRGRDASSGLYIGFNHAF